MAQKQYAQEELWKLYEKLSSELKEAVFSQETADHIWNICERYDIDEVSEVAKLSGNVLLGILPPEYFQETLEKEIKLEKEAAKKIAQEINRFIFYPVKPALEELYKIEITPSAKPTKVGPAPEEKPAEPLGKEDVYREPIE